VHDDSELPRAVQLRVFSKANGTCINCGKRIDGSRDQWVLQRLSDSGDELADNFAPAHAQCPVSARAAEDSPGAAGKSWPRKQSLPFGRKIGFKRKITGEIVKRD
jgi:hypothetical protein